MSPPPPDGSAGDVTTAADRRRSASSSPEFEFWRLRCPASDAPLLSAEELFLNGVILPLQRLPHLSRSAASSDDISPPPPAATPDEDPPPSSSSLTSPSTSPSSSKRWRDIFRSPEKKATSGGAALPELNIKLWPFSRSRSTGTSGGPTGKDAAARRFSSAPCSRSGSRREPPPAAISGAPGKKWAAGGREKEREPYRPPASPAGGRRWASSPGRVGGSGGVPVRRGRHVWPVRRGSKKSDGGQGKQFNLGAFFSRKLYI